MELRQLEYLVAAADHGGFTRGARAVRVSQPAMSQAIASLEREVGVDLFVRTGRSVRLTTAGETVVERARHVLREMADLGSDMAALKGLHVGRVDVVSLPTLAVDPLATVLGELRRVHPGITVRVHAPEDSAAVSQWVTSGRAELGLTDLTIGGRDLVRVELFRQSLVALCPPGTAPPDGPWTANMLASVPLVAAPVGTSTRRLLDSALSRVTVEPNIVVETDQRDAIVPLVLAGAGTALVPAGLAEEAAGRGAVVVPLRPALSRRIGLLHRAGSLSPAARAMIDLARATLSR